MFTSPNRNAIGFAATIGARAAQEDNFGYTVARGSFLDESSVLFFVVCDGMGGHIGGATASRTAVNAAIRHVTKSQNNEPLNLRHGMDAANDALKNSIKQSHQLDGMGTTFLGVSLSSKGIRWCSVGDSPLFLLRRGQITRLNEDHSMAAVFADMVDDGRMTASEAQRDPRRSALRSALSGDEVEKIDAPEESFALLEDDLLLLATDGIQTLPEEVIIGIANTDKTAQGVADALIREIDQMSLPEQDNTIIVVINPARLGWPMKRLWQAATKNTPKNEGAVDKISRLLFGHKDR